MVYLWLNCGIIHLMEDEITEAEDKDISEAAEKAEILNEGKATIPHDEAWK